jgi:predicted oxidoreductase
MLQSYLDIPLITNQIELSLYELENFNDGTVDLCLEKRIPPMAWSPLAGGRIFTSTDGKAVRLKEKLSQIAGEVGANSIDEVLYAWLLQHPAKIIPIVGSRKIERIESAINATKIKFSTEQWYDLLQASMGHEVP